MSDLVVYVDSINMFKNHLDKFWSNQDIMFDHTVTQLNLPESEIDQSLQVKINSR